MQPTVHSSTERMNNNDDPLKHIVPGTWWRLVGSYQGLENFEAPEHGLILLMKDVRIIDGEIHTLVLKRHPRDKGHGDILVLLKDLLINFSLEPKGEELRERELAELMGEIQGITETLANPPSDAEFAQRILETPKAESEEEASQDQDVQTDKPADKTSLVPAALLPSQDVQAAQKKIEHAIAVMDARTKWVQARTDELQGSMNLVASFQKEKVDQALAGMSEQRKQADNLLKNVHTMKLFLGEEQEFHQLVDGIGAEKSEPLHLMQKLLYLDEELFVHHRLEGIDGEDSLQDLSEVLSDNPSLVSRMLPYPRCVAIARTRRKTRPIEPPEGGYTIADLFSIMQQQDADLRVQILIRDGEKVFLVTSDEITSRAERLFPSKAEIDAIYSVSSYDWQERKNNVRAITPHDIEYSAKRSDHDARALFYKRVLLILWGLHEREQIFGNFLPMGANWLEETIASDHFAFIHDDENVLSDGRMGVHGFLAKNREKIQKGSRVLVYWDKAVTTNTAPTIFTENGSYTSMKYGLDLMETFGTSIAEEKDGDLIVKCPMQHDPWGDKPPREFKTNVKLRTYKFCGNRGRVDFTHGYICIDEISLEDIDYYFESRQHREHYLEYLHLFDRARSFLLAEQKELEPAVARVFAENNVTDTVAKAAIKTWRTHKKGAMPVGAKDFQNISRIAQAISTSNADVAPDADRIYVNHLGEVEVQYMDEVTCLGQKVPVVRQEVLEYKKRSGWTPNKRKGGQVVMSDFVEVPGKYLVIDRTDTPYRDVAKFHIFYQPGALETLEQAGDLMVGGRDLLQVATETGNPEFDYRFLFDMIEDELVGHERFRRFPSAYATVGYMYHPSEDGLFKVVLSMKPELYLPKNGREKDVRAFFESYFEHPDKAYDYLVNESNDTPYSFLLVKCEADEKLAADSTLEEVNVAYEMFDHPRHFGPQHLTVSHNMPQERIDACDDIRSLATHLVRSMWYSALTEEQTVERREGVNFLLLKDAAPLLEEYVGMKFIGADYIQLVD